MADSRAMRNRALALVGIGLAVVTAVLVTSRTGHGTPAEAEAGCYLNFVAQNGSNTSILVDISRSRIRSSGFPYGLGSWAKIENTSNQNIHAGTRRNFTVWAKLCGMAGIDHQVDFVIKKGANTKSLRLEHAGSDKTVSMGDLKRLFE